MQLKSEWIEVDYLDVPVALKTPTGWGLDRQGVYIIQTDLATGLYLKPKCKFSRSGSRGHSLQKALQWSLTHYGKVQVMPLWPFFFWLSSPNSTSQKVVSNLALKGENCIPAQPVKSQECSVVEDIINSVTLLPSLVYPILTPF
jgi:hypothetical protein